MSGHVGATTHGGGGQEPLSCLSFPTSVQTKLLVVQLFGLCLQTKAHTESENVKQIRSQRDVVGCGQYVFCEKGHEIVLCISYCVSRDHVRITV